MNIFLARLFCLLALGDSEDVGELVSRLGSSRFADRAAASTKLETLGEVALPAIEKAIDGTDPEVRIRAARLRKKIEAAVLGRPTQIIFEKGDVPFGLAVASLATPGSNRVEWHPGSPDRSRGVISLHDRGPIPFWSAIDRLCRAGDLHYLRPSASESGGTGGTQFRLFLAPGAEECPRSDSGPLRMEIVGILQHRYINLIPNPVDDQRAASNTDPPPPFGAKFSSLAVDLRLFVEPRLLIQRFGDAVVTEAIDDRGQTLIRNDGPHIQRWGLALLVPSRGCVGQLSLQLLCPPKPVGTIRRLSFSMPVEVVARRKSPLSIRLGGEGRASSRSKNTVRLEGLRVKDSPTHPRVLLSLVSEERIPKYLSLGPEFDGGRGEVGTRLVRPEVTADVLQVVDEQGRIFPWYGSPNVVEDEMGKLEVELHLDAGPVNPPRGRLARDGIHPSPKRAPAELCYYEYARTTIRASFTFLNVTIP